MNYPLVSIGIPTYNRADVFLKQALESAVSQTYPNIEIIVSDNCSTDNTEALVRSFNDPRIKYFRQEVNIGPVNNPNFCLQQASGAYFMQLHDDDMIDPDFVESCMNAADYSADYGIIRSGTRVIDANRNILQESVNNAGGLSATDFFRSWFACKISIYLCSTLFNTAKIKEMGGFKSIHNLFEDVVAYARLSKYGRADVKEIKASFRKHGGEETFSAKTRNWCEDSLYLLDIICDVIEKAEKDAVRKEGMQFLSQINYQFASAIKPWSGRYSAYFTVFSSFDYRYLPPPLKNILYRNPVIRGLRSLRNSLR